MQFSDAQIFYALIIIGVVVCFFIKVTMDLRKISEHRQLLMHANGFVASLTDYFNNSIEFLSYSDTLSMHRKLEGLLHDLNGISSIPLFFQVRKKRKEVKKLLNDFDKFRSESNQRFFEAEKERCRDIFFDGEKWLLTDEQIQAVLSDDDRNLVIAGAGSGKTKVIEFKVKYLINRKKIDPKKIVLLSFSKKSAEYLAHRLPQEAKGVEVRTIHSFSAQFVDRDKFDLFNDKAKELELLVMKVLAETLQDSRIFALFNKFYREYFYDLKPLIFYENLDDLRRDLRKANSNLEVSDDKFEEIKALRALKTLRGEFVRSVDERYIADFLYLHDIKYEYEMPYNESSEKYHPDFYLRDYDIYLEHFAITKDGNPPKWFDKPKRYLEGIEWKRKLHKSNGTKLIETYSFMLNDGDSAGYLKKVLSDEGVPLNISQAEAKAFNVINREFSKLFVRFYSNYKISGASLEEIRNRGSEKKYLLFLDLFEAFLNRFKSAVEASGKMDFSDMIYTAIERYKVAPPKHYEYLIIDEFQDTSNLAMKLLDLVLQGSPGCKMMAVGDDWQSIYGFNGSDVSILSEFSKKYPGVSVLFLNNNFRSHQRIVELGQRFITKNPKQIQKDVRSANRKFPISDVRFLKYREMIDIIKRIPDNESILIIYRYNDDCPAGRDEFRGLFYLDEFRRPVREKGCIKYISMMTIHGSKGLEAQHVFVLFPDAETRKFPSEIEDHFVFNMLKNNSDDYPFAEERRLLYVAITRAEQNLYFVATEPGSENSVFWEEIEGLVK